MALRVGQSIYTAPGAFDVIGDANLIGSQVFIIEGVKPIEIEGQTVVLDSNGVVIDILDK